MRDIKLLIFDLGGVIFDLAWEDMYQTWATFGAVPVEQLRAINLFDATLEAFERGQISPQEFSRRKCASMALAISHDQFMQGWTQVIADPFPGVASLFHSLKPGIKSVAFTNTSEPHLPLLMQRGNDVMKHFCEVYASFEIGHRKPEADGFLHILASEEVSAEHAVFFDDLETNVRGAEQVGIHGIHVSNAHLLSAILAELGVLQG